MKFKYHLVQQDDYTDISVFYDDVDGDGDVDGDESWSMDLDRDMQSFEIGGPWYYYSPSSKYTYEPIEWHDIPTRVQDHFNKHLRRAKTILILGDSK